MWRKHHHRGTQSLSIPSTTHSVAVDAARRAANAPSDSRNATLSAAAAAAALDIHRTPPPNPGDLVTKRMLQRQRSGSLTPTTRSRTPDSLAMPPRALSRQDSVSSMRDRTFRSRSQSPASFNGRHRLEAEPDVPPVPSLPNHVVPKPTHAAGNSGARHADNISVQQPTAVTVTPFRVASQRRKEGDPSWHGRATGDMDNIRTSDAPMSYISASNVAYSSPPSRSSSPSVNFSYPRSPTVQPQSSPWDDEESLVFDANSRRMVSRADLFAEERMQQAVDEQDARRKRAMSQQLSRSGSHLARGSTVGRTRSVSAGNGALVPAAAAAAAAATLTLTTTTPTTTPTASSTGNQMVPNHASLRLSRSGSNRTPASKPKPTLHSAIPAAPDHVRREPSPLPSHSRDLSYDAKETQSQETSDAPEISQKQLQRLDGVSTLASRSAPRTNVQSPIELEAGAVVSDDGHLAREPSSAQPLVQLPVQSLAGVREEDDVETELQDIQHDNLQPSQVSPPVTAAVAATQTARPSSPARARRAPSPERVASADSDADEPASRRLSRSPERRPSSATHRRHVSDSPARTARFAPSPEHLSVMHSPPARSASPRKSALKHSSSPSRYMSDDSSEASRDDGMPSRRRSVRVSFDDDAANGDAAEPTLPSLSENEPPRPLSSLSTMSSSSSSSPPSSQTKVRKWFGLGRKDGLSSLDEDEPMRPRPALPLFSSVRDKKSKDNDSRAPERALVRPHDGPRSAVKLDSHDRSDSPRNEANISRMREPPRQALSSERSPPTSDESDDEVQTSHVEIPSTIEELKEPEFEPVLAPDRAQAIKEEISQAAEPGHARTTSAPQIQTQTLPVLASQPQQSQQQQPQTLPVLALSPPTPAMGSFVDPDEFFDLPGQFPGHDDDNDVGDVAPAAAHARPVAPDATAVNRATPGTAAAAAPAATAATAASAGRGLDDSDDSSIYSDAYEDLTDVDGDGFLSLDAVLTKPEKKTSRDMVPGSGAADAPATHRRDENATTPQSQSEATSGPAQPTPALTSPPASTDDWEKVKAYWRGLPADKRRLLELEAGDEADLDQAGDEQPKKAKRKKSLEKRASEREVIRQSNPERVYQIKPGTKMSWPEKTDKPVSDDGSSRRHGEAASDGMRLRKSMRPDGGASGSSSTTMQATPQAAATGGTMRKSMRPTSLDSRPMTVQPSSQAAAPRPASSLGINERAAPQPQPQPAAGAPTPSQVMAAAILKTMRARADSDSSEGSAPRVRPASQTNFRSTMRGTGGSGGGAGGASSALSDEDERPPSKNRFSLRGLSPTGSPSRRRPFSAAPTEIARPSSAGAGFRPTMRNSAGADNKRAAGTKIKKKSKSRFASRLDGSSDEDASPSVFRSRFADSSDEEDEDAGGRKHGRTLSGGLVGWSRGKTQASSPVPAPAPATQPQTLPDTTPPPPPPPPPPQQQQQQPPQQQQPAPAKKHKLHVQLPQPEGGVAIPNNTAATRAPGVLTSLGTTPSSPSLASPSSPTDPTAPAHRRRGSSLVSALWRKKPYAASRSSTLVSDDPAPGPGGFKPTAPKLQKRTAQHDARPDWPLAAHPSPPSPTRPFSANGPAGATIPQPGFFAASNRRSSSYHSPTSAPAAPSNASSVTLDARAEPKKKSMMAGLRRVLGLAQADVKT